MRKLNLPLLVVIGVTVVGSVSNATVQESNPLRLSEPTIAQQPVQQQAVANQAADDMPAEIRDVIYEPARDQQSNPGTTARIPKTNPRVVQDSNLVQAYHAAKLEAESASSAPVVPLDDQTENSQGHSNEVLSSIGKAITAMTDESLDPRPGTPRSFPDPESRSAPQVSVVSQLDSASVESEMNSTNGKLKQDKNFDATKLQLLLKKVAINTGMVMCFGVGFIFVAKRFYKPKQASAEVEETRIRIKSTLRLSPKSNLFLVEAGEQRLIVASDQTGIKSVVALTKSFDNTLESLAGIAEPAFGETASDTHVADGLDTYSLASVGQPVKDGQRAQDGQQETAHEEPASREDIDEVRLRMEAALREHGLKDLFLKSLGNTG